MNGQRGHFLNRRSFLKRLSLAGLAAPFMTRGLLAQSPNSILRHASFGAAGMAGGDIRSLTANKFVSLVAVAEVELNRCPELKQRHPDVKIYQDWRELQDKEAKNIDSVNVSTPDHMHAPISMSALQLGKHVYCQKPLTQDIYEARQLTWFARGKKRVTQMGIQCHSSVEYRLAVQYVQEGVIGKVKEVHTWSNKKWGDADRRRDRSDPIPANFNWDLWLGISPTLQSRSQSDGASLRQTQSPPAPSGGPHLAGTSGRGLKSPRYLLSPTLPRVLSSCPVCVYLNRKCSSGDT